MPKRILLTGGCGFIGHHTVEHLLLNTDLEIIILDRLTYAGSLSMIADLDSYELNRKRIKFVYHDFRAPINDTVRAQIGKVDYIIHMGAESHVDRSIENALPFAESNVIGTVNMLDYAKSLNSLEKFVYVSTDEVYGPAKKNERGEIWMHEEGEAHRPSNPYSASKSGAEAFVYAYWNTYGLPAIITNTMNNFGERQHPEKFVPKVVLSGLTGKTVPVHCKKVDGEVVDISSRCWLHARNHADGIMFLLERGNPGERYNIVGEWGSVRDMVDFIGMVLEIEINTELVDFHSFRPGHDMHYGLDGKKMAAMGWKPPVPFFESLAKTVQWMVKKDNLHWLGLKSYEQATKYYEEWM